MYALYVLIYFVVHWFCRKVELQSSNIEQRNNINVLNVTGMYSKKNTLSKYHVPKC